MRRRDDLAIHNERVKLVVTILNAVGLAFFGLGVARPPCGRHRADHADDRRPSHGRCRGRVGVAVVATAYFVLGQLKTDDEADEETRR